MPKLFRKHSSILCFFCQSDINPLPRNPRSFRCPHCDCWNRYDAHGEIVSDEPAMHDENLNARSFERRASPRKDRIPTQYSSGLFCHTCQTNQMLLANLLSSYLPSPDDPEYEHRAQMLPEYRRSIEIRYPPICANCAPAVDEEIRKRDNMARTRALGGFLGSNRGTRQQVAPPQRDKEELARQLLLWKMRGFLWATTFGCSLAGHAAFAAGYVSPQRFEGIRSALPFLAVVSILWTAWDPKYAYLKRAEFQGRAMRQRGKREYNVLQIVAWLSRCLTSVLLGTTFIKAAWSPFMSGEQPLPDQARMYCSIVVFLEIIIFVRSWFTLRVERPPPVHLTADSSSSQHLLATTASVSPSRDGTPTVTVEPDMLAPLSLSSKPVVHLPNGTPRNPIFGLSSLKVMNRAGTDQSVMGCSNTAMDIEDDDDDPLITRRRDPDSMDWSPIRPSSSRNPSLPQRQTDDDGSWLRPQRFFAPEEPTGLEHIFANTVKLADDNQITVARAAESKPTRISMIAYARQHTVWLGLLCIVPLSLAVAFYYWRPRRIGPLESEL